MGQVGFHVSGGPCVSIKLCEVDICMCSAMHIQLVRSNYNAPASTAMPSISRLPCEYFNLYCHGQI